MTRSIPARRPPALAPAVAGLLALALAGCAATPDAGADPRARVAAAYDLERFDAIDGLRYTFNARLGDRVVARAWEWEPHTGRVQQGHDDDELFIYFRGPEGAPESARDVDAQFINDQYWLLFPLHLVRDGGLEVESRGQSAGPVTGRVGEHVVATYVGAAGYTPGDVYELWLDERSVVREWAFRPGGAPEPARTATWSEPVDVGPIRATLAFDGPDPSAFRVWFTDVAVRVDGGAWTPVD